MSRSMKFRSPAELHAAYARLVDQGWVDACTIDVPRLEMQVHVAEGATPRRRAPGSQKVVFSSSRVRQACAGSPLTTPFAVMITSRSPSASMSNSVTPAPM